VKVLQMLWNLVVTTELRRQFIKMIDKFFDALNVANLNTGKKKRKAFQSPYTSSKDFRLEVLSSIH